MTSPYSKSLLNHPADAAASITMPRPSVQAPQTRSITYPTPAPQMPVYVQMAPARTGSSASMALVVVLLAVIAGAAGYVVATSTAPSAMEVSRYQQIAGNTGYYNGRTQGISAGREFGIAAERQTAQLKALIARQRAYNNGYRQGKRTGINSYRSRPATRSYGYTGGYRRPVWNGYRSGGNVAVSSALAQAQGLANATGAPVDVEIY